jgi:probable phosphoglycerate mutase
LIESVTRLVAIRHGETDWNVDTRIQGQIDIGLNANGRWQARRLGRALAEEGFDAVYSSDLGRAMDTAHAVAVEAGLAVQPRSALRERAFGVFEGMTFAEIEQRFPEEALRWRRRDASFGPQGGETLADFYARAVAAVADLAARHRGQHIPQVPVGRLRGHAPARRALQVALLDQVGLEHVLDGAGASPMAAARLSTRPGRRRSGAITASSSLRSIRSKPSGSTSSIASAGRRRRAVDAAVGLDLGVVAHAAQQAVGDARRAARAAGDLQRAAGVDRHVRAARPSG